MLALATMASPATLPTPLFLQSPKPNRIAICSFKNHTTLSINSNPFSSNNTPLIFAYSSNSTAMPTALSWSETDQESEQEYEDEEEDAEEEEEEEVEEEGSGSSLAMMGHSPPVRTLRRRRYRKQYPGEKKGITEEMRFVAMKLRNSGKPKKAKDKSNGGGDDADDKECSATDAGVEDEQNGETWEPSIEGFLKYLVDSKLVFTTVERIVDESSDVSYTYFRKTGLERAECLSKDLEWFREQGNSIPEHSNPGITYAQYLEELAEKSPPLFMSHLYNIYFSHIAGGQVIAKKVSEKLLQGRELEFFKWEGNEEELLRVAREKLNMLGEHWSRDEKNKCLREATKAFRFLGQIVRLIIL